MRNRALLILNGAVILMVMALLFGRFSSVTGVAQEVPDLPGPAGVMRPAAHLGFMTFAETTGKTVTTSAHSLNADGRFNATVPSQTLFSPPGAARHPVWLVAP